MNQSKINVRYAKALFELGKERNQIRNLHEDITKISVLCAKSTDFLNLLDNPILSVSQKKELFLKILKSSISELAMQFILLITEHHRDIEIPGICRNFLEMVRKDQGIMPAIVTTAGKLTQETLSQISESLEKETGKEIELLEKVNPSIIGGIILRLEDQQFDGSIATQLKKIKTAMLSKYSE
jgi:F-type H+-transporting ATPase subunit delta